MARQLAATKLALLRQRFASMAQFRAHLVTSEGTVLIFFRDAAPPMPIGGEALVEIAFDDSEDTRVVRAVAFSRAEGQGIWLAMPSARFAREVREGKLMERKGRRLGTDRVTRLRRQSGSEFLVMLADVSLAGVRITGGLPKGLSAQDQVELQLTSPLPGEPVDPIAGRVVWRDDSDAGVEVDRSKPASRAAITRLFQSLEGRWRSAREVRHLDLCCREGKLLDPTPPRVRQEGEVDLADVLGD
ncbi:MAG: PilZ domain-containing protein [Myxococcales bacterium]|nr:PilZ domain-containing protein [Myxococcales bacterium]